MAEELSSTEDILAFIKKVKVFLGNESELNIRDYEALHKELGDLMRVLEATKEQED